MKISKYKIAKLVLGYLKSENCKSAHSDFLKHSRCLRQDSTFKKNRKHIITRIHGLCLEEILKEYAQLHNIIQSRLEETDYFKHGNPREKSLPEQLSYLLENLRSSRSSTPSHASPRSYMDCRNASSDTTDRAYELSTTPPESLPGNACNKERSTPRKSKSRLSQNASTPFGKESYGSSAAGGPLPDDPKDMSQLVTQTLLEFEFHEKIAEAINTVRNVAAAENNKDNEDLGEKAGLELDETIKVAVEKTTEDPIFEKILNEIIGAQPLTMSSESYARTTSRRSTSFSDQTKQPEGSSSHFYQPKEKRLENTSECTAGSSSTNEEVQGRRREHLSGSGGYHQVPTLSGGMTPGRAGHAAPKSSTELLYCDTTGDYLKACSSGIAPQNQIVMANPPGLLMLPTISTANTVQLQQPKYYVVNSTPMMSIGMPNPVLKTSACLTEHDIMKMPTIILNEDMTIANPLAAQGLLTQVTNVLDHPTKKPSRRSVRTRKRHNPIYPKTLLPPTDPEILPHYEETMRKQRNAKCIQQIDIRILDGGHNEHGVRKEGVKLPEETRPAEVQKLQEPPAEVQKVRELPAEVQKLREPPAEVQKVRESPAEVQKLREPPAEVQKVREPSVEKPKTPRSLPSLTSIFQTPKPGSHVRNLKFDTPQQQPAVKVARPEQLNKSEGTVVKTNEESLMLAKKFGSWDADLRLYANENPEDGSKKEDETAKEPKETKPQTKAKKKEKKKTGANDDEKHSSRTDESLDDSMLAHVGKQLEMALKTPVKTERRDDEDDVSLNERKENEEDMNYAKKLENFETENSFGNVFDVLDEDPVPVVKPDLTKISHNLRQCNRPFKMKKKCNVDNNNRMTIIGTDEITEEVAKGEGMFIETTMQIVLNEPVLKTPIKRADRFPPKTPGGGETANSLEQSATGFTPFTKFVVDELDCVDLNNLATPQIPITPGFPITPDHRPTDYSTSSSYYQPSDTEQNKSLEQQMIEECRRLESIKANNAVVKKKNSGGVGKASAKSLADIKKAFDRTVIGRKDLNLINRLDNDESDSSCSETSSSSDGDSSSSEIDDAEPAMVGSSQSKKIGESRSGTPYHLRKRFVPGRNKIEAKAKPESFAEEVNKKRLRTITSLKKESSKKTPKRKTIVARNNKNAKVAQTKQKVMRKTANDKSPVATTITSVKTELKKSDDVETLVQLMVDVQAENDITDDDFALHLSTDDESMKAPGSIEAIAPADEMKVTAMETETIVEAKEMTTIEKTMEPMETKDLTESDAKAARLLQGLMERGIHLVHRKSPKGMDAGGASRDRLDSSDELNAFFGDAKVETENKSTTSENLQPARDVEEPPPNLPATVTFDDYVRESPDLTVTYSPSKANLGKKYDVSLLEKTLNADVYIELLDIETQRAITCTEFISLLDIAPNRSVTRSESLKEKTKPSNGNKPPRNSKKSNNTEKSGNESSKNKGENNDKDKNKKSSKEKDISKDDAAKKEAPKKNGEKTKPKDANAESKSTKEKNEKSSQTKPEKSKKEKSPTENLYDVKFSPVKMGKVDEKKYENTKNAIRKSVEDEAAPKESSNENVKSEKLESLSAESCVENHISEEPKDVVVPEYTADTITAEDDLMNYAVVGSQGEDETSDADGLHKRKASFDDNGGQQPEKKAKVQTCQILLKKINVDTFLDKLHGNN